MNSGKYRTVTGFTLEVLQSYKGCIALCIFVGILWALVSALQPYVLKIIIDTAVAVPGADAFASMQPWLIIYILLPSVQRLAPTSNTILTSHQIRICKIFLSIIISFTTISSMALPI